MSSDARSGNATLLTATLASEAHFDAFYRLRCDPENIYWTGHEAIPDRDVLRKWYARNIADPARTFLLFELEHSVVGYLYIDKCASAQYEIGFGVHRETTGQGVGRAIVKAAEVYVRQHLSPAGTLTAWVADRNVPSIKCLVGNGFSPTEQNRSRSLGGEMTTFHLYQKKFGGSTDS